MEVLQTRAGRRPPRRVGRLSPAHPVYEVCDSDILSLDDRTQMQAKHGSFDLYMAQLPVKTQRTSKHSLGHVLRSQDSPPINHQPGAQVDRWSQYEIPFLEGGEMAQRCWSQRERAVTPTHYQRRALCQPGLVNTSRTRTIVSCRCERLWRIAHCLIDERHLTKQAISPPFNFMHVTHTEKSKLPALDTVDEKDLPGEFWSVSAYQRPRRHLHGIKAEDLRKKRPPREMSPISPVSTNTNRPPVSPIVEDAFDNVPPVIPQRSKRMTPLDETMFDGISHTIFDTEDGVLSLEPAKQVVRYPKRYSSLNALDELSKAAGEEPSANTFYESSSNASEDPGSRTVSPNIVDDQPDKSKLPASNIDILADVPNFPLPPLPNKRPSQNQFKKFMAPSGAPNISVVIPQPVSPRSKRSSRSLKSSLKSPTFSPHSDSRNSMTFFDVNNWEDDVDFYYEQGAESTCDFNWDIVGAPRKLSAQTDSSQLSIPQSYHAVSPAVSNDSTSSFRFRESNTSTETIAERRKSRVAQPPSHHRRGSSVASVGHRGFLAARKSSTDLTALAENATLPPIQISANSARVSVLSPVFSVTGADDEPQKLPFTPDALKFPRFDSVITDNLSDPESNRNSGSSKHRKSSSYGSHESTARPPPNAAKESNRWSVASVSSLPDLLHPRRSKTFLSKTIISAPLETLPQSPPIEMDGAQESTVVPRELQSQPVRNSFVMRRPQHSGDRAAMQAAGRMVQRRSIRPETGQRMSTIIQTPDGLAVPEATKTGPQWI